VKPADSGRPATSSGTKVQQRGGLLKRFAAREADTLDLVRAGEQLLRKKAASASVPPDGSWWRD